MSEVDPLPPALLVIAHGVDADEVAVAAGLPADGHVAALPPTGDDPTTALCHREFTPLLRWHGVALDRRSLVLRAPGRSDECAVAQLGERPAGPATVALLELGAALTASMRQGVASTAARQAIAATGALVREAACRLRRGDDPEIWIVATGRARAVTRTVDFYGALRASVAPMLRRHLRCHVRPEVAAVSADSQRVRDLLEARLCEPPFRTIGQLWRNPRPNGPLQFVPVAGIAFGTVPLQARAAVPGARSLSVRLPRVPRSALPLDLAGVFARFWLAAAARAPQHSAPGRRLPTTPVQAPDLLWALRRPGVDADHGAPRLLPT